MEHANLSTTETDARRFQIHGNPDKPRLVHVEKSGPAFLPVAVADMLGASLVAQTGTAIGDVLNAIQRKCLLDLMAAWTRLLNVYHVTPSEQSRTALRRDWFWGEAFDAIVMALCRCETEHALVRWHVADMLIRGEAAIAAEDASRALAPYDALSEPTPDLDTARENLAAYRKFAEGRER